MKEQVIENISTKTQYITCDGQVYDWKDQAELHEQFLVFAEEVAKLKETGGAYFCKTQEDFDAIIDMKAYAKPVFDYFGTKSYIPNYCYDKTDFKGPDWYFFKYEYHNEGADDYWVESLSEKKTEWDEFYNQFEIEEERS